MAALGAPQSPPVPPPYLPSELDTNPRISAPSFPQYIYQVSHPNFRRLPQSTDHFGKRTGAVVKRLWVEGQRRGISATEMPGFDSRSAKQNFPQELQEDFRTHPPPLDRREALDGELFDFFFISPLLVGVAFLSMFLSTIVHCMK